MPFKRRCRFKETRPFERASFPTELGTTSLSNQAPISTNSTLKICGHPPLEKLCSDRVANIRMKNDIDDTTIKMNTVEIIEEFEDRGQQHWCYDTPNKKDIS